MAASRYDFTLDQGYPLEFNLELQNKEGQPKNITNHVVKGNIKASFSASDPVIALITGDITDPVTGKIKINISENALSNYELQTVDVNIFPKLVYEIGLFLDDNGTHKPIGKLLYGVIKVNPKV